MANGRSNGKRKVRVAIVGGGCAGLAAAWALTQTPQRRHTFDVRVFEASWRLGGKGASGRDADGRIREHGLHIWLGFYENAFRMMRDCYEDVRQKDWGPLAKEPKDQLAHGTIDDAFFPEHHIGVALPAAGTGSDPRGPWKVWSGHLPPAPGLPGEELLADSNPFTLPNYLLRCYELLKTLMLSVAAPGDARSAGQSPERQRHAFEASLELEYAFDPVRTQEDIVEWSARLLRGSALTAAGILLQTVCIVDKLRERLAMPPASGTRIFQLATAVLAQARKLLADLVGIDPELRRKTEVIDIVITIAVGLFRNRVLFDEDGLDALNDFDYREWLRDNGCSPSALASEFLTGIYDLTFAYEDGDKSRPRLAAGVALRGALRMFFTYRGAMFWRMRSGMGDAVFAPLYKVLMDRGVHFEFLHRLVSWDMGETAGERFVTALHFQVDGAPAKGENPHAPALDARGCWPDTARLFAKAEAAAEPSPFTDFDAVIFATGAPDFVDAGERSGFFASMPEHWGAMRDNVTTVATQCAQVWLTADLDDLGWRRGSGIMTAAPQPFETWADMTHTLATEKAWRDGMGVASPVADSARSVAYFCGVLAEKDIRAAGDAPALVQGNLGNFLAAGVQSWWPAAGSGGGGIEALMAGPSHVQANVAGSDRYTQSLPRKVRHRVSPLERVVANMTVAGDWTASGLDAGCVEGAVMSGLLAAYAISGDEKILKDIVGFDHP